MAKRRIKMAKNVTNVTRIGQKRGMILKIIIETLEKGSTISNACERAGISRTTLWRWQKIKSINNRILSVIETRTEIVEDALFKRAKGYEYLEKRVEKTPAYIKSIAITKEVAPDVVACIFYLCNRKPKRWQNKQQVDHKGQVMSIAQIVNIVNGNNGNNNNKQARVQTGSRINKEVR